MLREGKHALIGQFKGGNINRWSGKRPCAWRRIFRKRSLIILGDHLERTGISAPLFSSTFIYVHFFVFPILFLYLIFISFNLIIFMFAFCDWNRTSLNLARSTSQCHTTPPWTGLQLSFSEQQILRKWSLMVQVTTQASFVAGESSLWEYHSILLSAV